MSLSCPGEPIRRTGLPSASPAAWILVLKPPRDRPRPWASAPLFAGLRQPRADVRERWSSRSSATPDRLHAPARPKCRPERPFQCKRYEHRTLEIAEEVWTAPCRGLT